MPSGRNKESACRAHFTVSLTGSSMSWPFLVWTISAQRPGLIVSGTLNLMAVAVCSTI